MEMEKQLQGRGKWSPTIANAQPQSCTAAAQIKLKQVKEIWGLDHKWWQLSEIVCFPAKHLLESL